ncbi:MAG TPA: exosortase/archaeosortase family protein [Opitutaceae bacterium]|nr:exosortase/archaeosortase family protein [Opitutaceae bacterium]
MPSFTRVAAGLPLLAKFNLMALALAVVATCALLWPNWRTNPDLSHGFFMPVVFLALLHESRTTGTQRWLPATPLTSVALIALLVAGIVALVGAGLYAAALGWSHALVNFVLVLSLVLLLGAGLVGFSTTTLRLIPFNWSAIVAVGLWLLSAPMPLGTYTRLTLSLQLWVSENVLRGLHVLGVAAHRQGNIIELAGGSVGVAEACSGVRSLISCVFAALFFSASLVRRPVARALVVILAVPLALGMNFIRSLVLTLLANAGVNIEGAWHDGTGFAVLGVTALILGALALFLGRERKKQPVAASASATEVPAATTAAHAWRGSQIALTSGLAVALGLAVLFYANTHPSIRDNKPVPDLLAVLPAESPGWRVTTSDDLYQFASQLQTKHLAQRIYTKRTASGPVDLTVYLAYWRSGQASVSQVATHTPDACWPGSGWESIKIPFMRERPTVDGRSLAEAEARLFKLGDFPQHVWFWHLYDGRPIAYESPYSPKALLQIAWRYGFQHDGDQLFVRVSSNVPWDKIADEPLLKEIFTQLQPLGL